MNIMVYCHRCHIAHRFELLRFNSKGHGLYRGACRIELVLNHHPTEEDKE